MQVVIGRIGRPHGIRGEVTVEVRTDSPDIRYAPGSVLVTEPGSFGPVTVAGVRWHQGRMLLALKGVVDRNAAEALRGVILSTEVDAADSPGEPDEFYDHQLVGLRAELSDGTPLGEVDDVVHLPAQDLLSVVTGDSREILIPFVAEFVPTVDIAAGRIIVAPPPGLLELDDPQDSPVSGVDDVEQV
jgi:16S rRNA processing protein RimM